MILHKKTILPAEWAPQDAILLCWPHESMDWEPILAQVEPVFDQIAAAITGSESLIIIAHDRQHQSAISQRLNLKGLNQKSIHWLLHPNNDTWCRDFGPIIISRNNQTIALDFQFNGWGNKFEFDADNQLTAELKKQQLLNCDVEAVSLVLEAGSIESDGEGTLLTTEKCLLSASRNPLLNKQQIENQLNTQLGCERILWLKNGQLEGDDTDSHIDNLARFCSSDTIAYASCDDYNDPHYQWLKLMEAELKQFRTTNNLPYELIALSIPKPLYDDGQRLAASYVNFLITNRLVLVPTFNDPNDEINLDKLQSVFTDRKVIAIPCSDIVKQSGAIHCLTMQLPANSLKDKLRN